MMGWSTLFTEVEFLLSPALTGPTRLAEQLALRMPLCLLSTRITDHSGRWGCAATNRTLMWVLGTSCMPSGLFIEMSSLLFGCFILYFRHLAFWTVSIFSGSEKSSSYSLTVVDFKEHVSSSGWLIVHCHLWSDFLSMLNFRHHRVYNELWKLCGEDPHGLPSPPPQCPSPGYGRSGLNFEIYFKITVNWLKTS